MPDCEMIAKCIFFNDKMADKPGTAAMMKQKYCQGDSFGVSLTERLIGVQEHFYGVAYLFVPG